MKTPEPFSGNAEFLDLHYEYLGCRVQRLVAEREVRQIVRREPDGLKPGVDDDLIRRLGIWQAREDRLHELLEARLEAHRRDPSAHPLGIDVVCIRYDLTEEARTVLLSALCSALSEELSEATHGDLGAGGWGTQSAEGVMRLLDGQSVADRVRLRRMFHADAPLVRSGLIVMDYMRNDAVLPEDALGARVRLTQMAFDLLVGEVPHLKLVGT